MQPWQEGFHGANGQARCAEAQQSCFHNHVTRVSSTAFARLAAILVAPDTTLTGLHNSKRSLFESQAPKQDDKKGWWYELIKAASFDVELREPTTRIQKGTCELRLADDACDPSAFQANPTVSRNDGSLIPILGPLVTYKKAYKKRKGGVGF